jgi:hypothetical protein
MQSKAWKYKGHLRTSMGFRGTSYSQGNLQERENFGQNPPCSCEEPTRRGPIRGPSSLAWYGNYPTTGRLMLPQGPSMAKDCFQLRLEWCELFIATDLHATSVWLQPTGFSQTRIKIFRKTVRLYWTWLQSPKQIVCLYTAPMWSWVSDVIWRWFEVCRNMCTGWTQDYTIISSKGSGHSWMSFSCKPQSQLTPMVKASFKPSLKSRWNTERTSMGHWKRIITETALNTLWTPSPPKLRWLLFLKHSSLGLFSGWPVIPTSLPKCLSCFVSDFCHKHPGTLRMRPTFTSPLPEMPVGTPDYGKTDLNKYGEIVS